MPRCGVGAQDGPGACGNLTCDKMPQDSIQLNDLEGLKRLFRPDLGLF